jgi:hypothetical protein
MSNNDFDSVILDLETLIKQYDVILTQYKQVQSDYNSYLQNNNGSSQLTNIKNSLYQGTSVISNTRVQDINSCSALCSKTTGCSGATFKNVNVDQPNCIISSGNGSVLTTKDDSYAIIFVNKNYLLTLEQLNSQLIVISNKIIQKFQNNTNIFTNSDINRLDKYNVLKQNYMQLESQRSTISDQLKNFQSLEGKYNESQLIVQKNYYNYILLLFIVIVCFLLLSSSFTNYFSESIAPFIFSYAGIFLIVLVCIYFLYVFSYFFPV